MLVSNKFSTEMSIYKPLTGFMPLCMCLTNPNPPPCSQPVQKEKSSFESNFLRRVNWRDMGLGLETWECPHITTVYGVHCALFTVHCLLYTVHFTVYSVHYRAIQNTVVQCIELQGNRCGPGWRHLNIRGL